ncbi:MAG: hypothetical protein CVT74_06525 [Alphaproteobacteria bacterium HGW-Alphaproteobacteria-13]|jgi:2Fe-2S ferredoxin|nr:MAG: hypothetical protein CVT74_06525 [Alphaproteobacteria bacterium HGW-Alphaproteobacteria-13]
MPKINYITADGEHQVVDVPTGWSLMEGAVKNGLNGILADCGGFCTCSTCQVIIDGEWAERVPPRTGDEEEMLEFAADPQPGSRLSCQITVTDELDGMEVRLPRTQLL